MSDERHHAAAVDEHLAHCRAQMEEVLQLVEQGAPVAAVRPVLLFLLDNAFIAGQIEQSSASRADLAQAIHEARRAAGLL